MAQIQMVMPKMGESIMEGTILNWLKKVGDRIEQDESILEVATDKVDTEVPSTHAGVVIQILAKEGDVVPIGKPILVIETEGDGAAVVVPASAPVVEHKSVASTEVAIPVEPVRLPGSSASDRFYSPLVRNIAKEVTIDK